MNTINLKVYDLATLIGRNPYKSAEECKKIIYSNEKRIYMKSSDAKRIIEIDSDINVLVNSPAGAASSNGFSHLNPEEFKNKRDLAGRISGILGEKDIAAQFTAETKIKIYNNANVDRIIHRSSNYEYHLKGRADGICYINSRKCIIEIKRRMEKFMQPEYDLIQIQAYMYLYDIRQAILIQSLNGQIKHEKIIYDEDLFKKYLSELKAVLI